MVFQAKTQATKCSIELPPVQYLELTGREAEFVALSRDTTESDLKQRREIRDGTAHYVDQVSSNILEIYLDVSNMKFISIGADYRNKSVLIHIWIEV